MAFLRAREVEDQIKQRGYERGVVWCLQTLAEQQIALQQDMRTLAELVDQQTNIIMQFATVSQNMKNALDNLNSAALFEDGMPKNTQDLD